MIFKCRFKYYIRLIDSTSLPCEMVSAPYFFLYISFNNIVGLLYQSLMLHNIFENRISLKIGSLRPHEILTLFSKAGSSLPTLWSITSPCFDTVRKHLKRILQIFQIFLQFSAKNNNFLKNLSSSI